MNSPPLPEEHIRLWDGTINPTFKKDKVKVNGNHIDFLTNAQNFKSEGSEFVFTSTGFLASQNGVGMSRVNVMVSGKSSFEKIRTLTTTVIRTPTRPSL